MRGFLKGVLATITGISIVGIIAVFVVYAILTSAISSDSYELEDNTILVLNMTGVLKDRTSSNPILKYLETSSESEIALSDITSAIKKAKENEKIKGIYIRSGYLVAANASLLEIRNELKDFRESGKFIVAYGDVYPQSVYFVSSVAHKIALNPQGNLDLHGLSSSRMFYKNLFDKLGVEIQVFKVGTYKSAVEPFIQEKMSDANREQVNSYVSDIWKTITTEISSSRNISIEKLNAITDTLPTFREAQFAVNNMLADTLMYETEAKKYLASLVNEEEITDLKFANVTDMKSVKFKKKKKSSDKIAVLYAEGSIVSGNSSDDISDGYYVKQIEKLKNNDEVKAVVLRVNSGGGSAYASEQIWKAIADLKEKKPIVVSMGDYAASGGYYIACNANKIIAQPSTLTGSIGIFGMFPNVEGLTQKIGFNFDNVKTNRLSDFGEITRPMREEEKIILQDYINRGYDLFLTRCAEGRNIPKDSINKIAQGRVWTGNQALKIGLVDALGGIDKAVEEASKLAKIDSYEIKEYPIQKSIWQELLGNKKEKLAIGALKEYFGTDYELIKIVKDIKELKQQDFIQARLPYNFKVE